MKNYDLSDIEHGHSGMDAFFASEPRIVSPVQDAQPLQKVKVAAQAAVQKTARVKVGSVQQLKDFSRVSSDTLIHKSTQDLWSIRQDGEDYYIERLFSDGAPIKG